MLLLLGDQGNTSFLRWLDSDRLIVGMSISACFCDEGSWGCDEHSCIADLSVDESIILESN